MAGEHPEPDFGELSRAVKGRILSPSKDALGHRTSPFDRLRVTAAVEGCIPSLLGDKWSHVRKEDL